VISTISSIGKGGKQIPFKHEKIMLSKKRMRRKKIRRERHPFLLGNWVNRLPP